MQANYSSPIPKWRVHWASISQCDASLTICRALRFEFRLRPSGYSLRMDQSISLIESPDHEPSV